MIEPRPSAPRRVTFRLLWGPMLIAALTVVGCGWLGAQAWGRYHRFAILLHSQQDALNAARDRLRRLETQERLMRAHWNDYRRLRAAHLPEEDRPGWIEAIRAAALARPGTRAGWSLQPPRLLARGPAAGAPALYGSPMRLTVNAVHELGWLELMRGLARQAPGIHRVRRCRVDFDSNGATRPAPALPLKAVCELDWLTLVDTAPSGEGAGR